MPSPFTSVICFREEPPSRAKEAKKQREKRSPERLARRVTHALQHVPPCLREPGESCEFHQNGGFG